MADRYRETGDNDKAEALYKELLGSQPTPKTYRALAASLFKRRKAADLLKVTSEAWARPETQEAIKPQLAAIAADDAMTDAMLDVGLEQLQANPPSLTKPAQVVLSLLAVNPSRESTNRTRRLEKLLRLERLLAEQNASDEIQSEISNTLRRLGSYAPAASALEQLMAKYPNTRSVLNLVNLADLHHRAGHNEAVNATLREAMKLDPGDPASQYRLANLLSEVGRVDESIRIFREASKKEPNNYIFDLSLGGTLSRFGRNEEAIKVFEICSSVLATMSSSSRTLVPICRSFT